MGTFKDALKKWFYTENSSAASSDARVALMDANGDPKGSDTMLNVAKSLNYQTIDIPSSTDLNNCTQLAGYVCTGASTAATLINCPINKAFRMDVYKISNSTIFQRIISNEGDVVFIRRSLGGTFGSWYRFSGTVVS